MEQGRQKFIVHFDRIMVNAVGHSSGIFIGTNCQTGWSSHSKTNVSIHGVSGDANEFVSNIHVIYDDDQIDTPIDDRDVFLSSAARSKAS